MKNCIDMPIFHRAICAENVTNSPYPTRETALQISLAVPRTKTFSEWRGFMRKYVKIYKILTIVILVAIGCIFTVGHFRHRDINDLVESHEAKEMYRNGIWKARYIQHTGGTSEETSEWFTAMRISINVMQDMTEEDMLTIMDYYEMIYNASYVGDSYEGEGDKDYFCYAVFYRKDTDEEIRRIKYHNGKEEKKITEKENLYKFPSPDEEMPEEQRGGDWDCT